MRSFRALSYINNLHPKTHRELYFVIEQIIAKAIPLWNETMTQVINEENQLPFPSRVKVPDFYREHYRVPKQRKRESYKAFVRRLDEYDKKMEKRTVVQPEPDKFKPARRRIKKVDLGKYIGKIQVIVKLTNIHLTPEKPSYGGGSWHVEGQLNEDMYVQPSALTRSL